MSTHIALFWEWYRDLTGGYRVKATHQNGRIAFTSSEAYQRKGDALKNALLFGAPSHLRYAKERQRLKWIKTVQT